MADLTTRYMGLELSSPIVVGASNLVDDSDKLKACEDAGAGAVVFKSLFEEQIQLELYEQDEIMNAYTERNPEMISLFPRLQENGPVEYLWKLQKAKETVKIPVIASINAVSDVSWVDYSKRLEDTGIDALELNLYHVPDPSYRQAREVEEKQLEIVQTVKEAMRIPVSVKLSPYYTNIIDLVSRMDKSGVSAFVLFNRLFQPEIDIENEVLRFPWNLSHSGDSRLALRFAALLYGNIQADIAASNGVQDAKDAISMILAGAKVVQVVSTLYRNKVSYIKTMLDEMAQWMDAKKYKTLDDFRGKLSKKNVKDPFAYQRAQYIDILFGSGVIFNQYNAV